MSVLISGPKPFDNLISVSERIFEKFNFENISGDNKSIKNYQADIRNYSYILQSTLGYLNSLRTAGYMDLLLNIILCQYLYMINETSAGFSFVFS